MEMPEELEVDVPDSSKKVVSKQKAIAEKKLATKKMRLMELNMKYERNRRNGDQIAGSAQNFEKCLKFFAEKVTSEDMGDQEAREVD